MIKLHFILALTFSLLTFVSCGSDEDDNESAIQQEQQQKSLFSTWTERNGFTLDFTRASFSAPSEFSIYSRSRAEICSCTIFFSGDELAGNMEMSSCSFTGTGEPPSDPGCELFENSNRPYSYTKSDSTLVICASASNCDTFQ